MTANEYQKLAMRTAPKRFESREEMLLNGVMGLCGEAGEALEILKKVRLSRPQDGLEACRTRIGRCGVVSSDVRYGVRKTS